MIVKHIHKEGRKEIVETLDLSNCEQPYCYDDKITISKEGNHTFIVTNEDLEELYERKCKNRC